MRVLITRPADKDLEDIFDFIARDNVPAAIEYVRELRAKALGLGDFPRMYRLRRDLPTGNLRTAPAGSHLIVYRVTRSRVEVLRFAHGAMDLIRMFGGTL
ncbi:MAG: type II toxin-antitoxin system RelE/ParE family toxin [Alphaproteobacteria bacterium]|nr:type II toxin-antitoxin system RelE/ParE family toxin [Alphaproteobacteria bacterium]MBV9542389.1 type II toxin-antitoxin system RelE/ParE family toxin [Alphaproteobacteria bacterium]MBV9905767.1 type II toxin-antitoxin system RelE/ParE family toxin [Alphaproteobacteria bacterium]